MIILDLFSRLELLSKLCLLRNKVDNFDLIFFKDNLWLRKKMIN